MRKIKLLKCLLKTKKSGLPLFYVTDEKQTAGLFYEEGLTKWTNLDELKLKESYKNLQSLFTPKAVYKSITQSYDVTESTWLELLVATGHTQGQLLNLLYEGEWDGQNEEDLPLD